MNPTPPGTITDMTTLPLIILALLLSAAIAAIFLLLKTNSRLSAVKARHEAEIDGLRQSLDARTAQLLETTEKLENQRQQNADLAGELKVTADRLRTIEQRLREEQERLRKHHEEEQKRLTETFKALSSDLLKDNSAAFLNLAKSSLETIQERSTQELDKKRQAIEATIKPLKDGLERMDNQIRELEKARSSAYSSLAQQLKQVNEGQARLKAETENLSRSLRRPSVRGRWGEIQLRRVVEMAGMVEYCDFIEQQTSGTEGSRMRPDLVVKLPGKKNIVVDSKAAILSYLKAQESDDEDERQRLLSEHAATIRSHITALGSKAYWEQFQPSPEFVILFLPGENFFSAALSQDHGLIEFGVNQKVLLATPTTLIAMLRAVSYGWRQENMAEHAQAIGELGRELYDRLAVMGGHFHDLGRSLTRTLDTYNKAVGSFESRVMVTARKFRDLDPLVSREIRELTPVDRLPRTLNLPEEKDLNP